MHRSFLQGFLSVMLLFFTVTTAYAWDCHFLLSYVALRNMPEISQKATIPAETLNSFLQKEQKGLAEVLRKNELWSEKNIPYYPTLPAKLNFTGKRKLPLQTQFLEAIRVNPEMSFPLFFQYPPNAKHRVNAQALSLFQVLLPVVAKANSTEFASLPLEGIKPNQKISPLEIISSASDEPDYGMDVNLWENSGTWYGKLYQWGNEPFGDPGVATTSQAPFHMGLYYESPWLYKLDPYLHDCYPEYRIHLYIALSRFAFKTGHPYWGYRFLGWALHYLQDLTQPYHTTLAPNVSTGKLLWVSVLDFIGIHGPENKVIQQETNRHFILENYQYHFLKKIVKIGNKKNPILQALTDTSWDSHYPAYNNLYPREVVAKESHGRADTSDAAILADFPEKYTENVKSIFYLTDPNINLWVLMKKEPQKNIKAIDAKLVGLFRPIGSHSRNLVRYVLAHSEGKR